MVSVDITMTAERIIGAEETVPGQYPFLAALFELRNFKKEFFCGGTLISTNHVLTGTVTIVFEQTGSLLNKDNISAAHCVQPKGATLPKNADDISLLLGKYNLTSEEKNVIQSQVMAIHINPQWNASSFKYDADLAILVLNVKVSFSRYIRPVCLPNKIVPINGMSGSIAGWGLIDNNRTSATIMKHANISVLTTASNVAVALISTNRTFCGQGNGAPNDGDSGGGFFVRSDHRWMQYGIVSSVVSDVNENVETNAISVYTNVQEFKEWIEGIMFDGGDTR